MFALHFTFNGPHNKFRLKENSSNQNKPLTETEDQHKQTQAEVFQTENKRKKNNKIE